MSNVILVNALDEPIGEMEKLQAHKEGRLHRAFSVFIFNEHGQMLLQQRAADKYHSAGLWSNACCSHPLPGEETLQAAQRRLQEELGFSTPLTHAFHFTYQSGFDNGLIEHEFDHVFTGHYSGEIVPERSEVQNFTYIDLNILKEELISNPGKYTSWFIIAYPKLEEYLAAKLL